MSESSIEYILGTPEEKRDEAAQLYETAFGKKFSMAVASQSDRVKLISHAFLLQYSVAAICDGQLVGIAGFQTEDGSLTGGMSYRQLISQMGFFRGNRAAVLFSLYERKPVSRELLMDGIAVDPKMRGKGIGTRLLEELFAYARRKQFEQIRLDVIDTNPQARKLYERNGFVETKTEHFGYLRWLLGFGASTTMVYKLSPADK